MRPAHRVLLFALMASTAGVSCRFLSDGIPTVPSEPSPYVNDLTLVFVPASLPDGQIGVYYQVQVSVENVRTFVGEFLIIRGSLPGGLSLERVPGENSTRITGTPKEAGSFTFVMRALCEGTNNPGQTGQKEYTITVK
jgi:hypothetical protein